MNVPRNASRNGHRARLYLDVDGVLNAYPQTPGHFTEATVTQTIEGYQTSMALHFDIDTLEEVQQLRVDFDLELVWLTTWLEDRSILRFVDTIGTLPHGRLLEIPRRMFNGHLPQRWKIDALIADMAANPVPFIWCDDDEVPTFGGEAAALFGVPSLTIAPNFRTGLQPRDLARMRAFLELMGASTSD